MSRDPKNNFYRTLNLPKEEREVLKWYRTIIKKIKNDSESKTITIKEEKLNET